MTTKSTASITENNLRNFYKQKIPIKDF